MIRYLRKFLIFGVLFFTALNSFAFIDYKNYSSLGKIIFENSSTIQKYAVVKKGTYLVFQPYTGVNISNKNKLTFVKPQSVVKVIAKIKNEPFYFGESDNVIGFIKEETFTFIDEDNLSQFLSMEKLYLKKPLLIGDILFPPATEVRYRDRTKDLYEVYIWDNQFYKAHITKKNAIIKLKPEIKNYKSTSKFFIGYPYFWAGSDEGWDCSLLVKDFYKIFDFDLPRNSYQQINYVESFDVANLSLKEKIRVLKKSKPFETLLYFPGHIMIFSGFKGKEPMSFQAINRFNNKYYGKVGYFPLKKTGLLQKVTKIGYIAPLKQSNLTISKAEGKIQSIVRD